MTRSGIELWSAEPLENPIPTWPIVCVCVCVCVYIYICVCVYVCIDG